MTKKIITISSALFVIVVLAGCGQQEVSQTQVSNPTTTVVADSKTYQDPTYGYQFQYPSDWTLVGNNNTDPTGYNVTIQKGNKDNIQIVKDTYGTNADGSVSSKESYLTRFDHGGYSKMTIAGGTGYYFIGETKGGPVPAIYLIGDKALFLMSFNIYDSTKTPLADEEKIFKQIIGTFQFAK